MSESEGIPTLITRSEKRLGSEDGALREEAFFAMRGLWDKANYVEVESPSESANLLADRIKKQFLLVNILYLVF